MSRRLPLGLPQRVPFGLSFGLPQRLSFGLRQRGIALMAHPETLYPLDWIDDYIARVRDYIFVREEDCLLIKVPNEAHKLNPPAVAILARLLNGEHIETLWISFGGTEEIRRDLYHFFVAMKQALQGCLNENRYPEAITVRPFALGFNTLPVLSEVALTYRCNLQCKFCYAACACRKGDAAELNTEDARRVLRVIRNDAKAPSVSFTGGEPCLRPDLPELIAYARRELKLRVNLITNGTLIDDALAALLHHAGLNSAQVSLESADPRVHDDIVGQAGAFDRTLHGLRRLKEHGIHVHTNTTLNRLNLPGILRLPAFLRGLGLDRFSMNLIIPAGDAAKDAALTVRYSEAAGVVPRLQREAQRCGLEFMWYSPTPLCIFNPIQHRLGNKGCAACDGLLSVSPTGDVLPCSSWPEPVGNLLREPFAQVWNGAAAAMVRAKNCAPEMCAACADFAVCQGACPLYWRHFGLDELIEHGERYVAAGG
jgi:radical SAM protein with 4Fe4S-binding SPASM domain